MFNWYHGKKLNISKAWFKPKGRVGDDDDDDDGGIPLSSRRRASLQSIQSSSSSGSSVQNRLVPLIPGYVFNQPCPVYLPPFNIVYFYWGSTFGTQITYNYGIYSDKVHFLSVWILTASDYLVGRVFGF